jgi:hypothetical protein
MIRLTEMEKMSLSRKERLVLFWRLNPVQCAKDVFDVDLIWFQRIIIRALFAKNSIFLFLGRGVGKTWLLALYFCMKCILYPRTKVGYYTPTAKQWDTFWGYLEEFKDNCPLFADSIRIDKNEKPIKKAKGTHKIKFKNGSFIESIALTEKSRGRRNTEAAFDEYKDHDVGIVNTVALPFLMVEKGDRSNKQIVATTGFYTWNHTWYKYVFFKYKEYFKDKNYILLQFDERDVNIPSNISYRISQTILEQIKNEPMMTEEKYDMEVYCKIASESDAVFSYRLLSSNKVTPRGEGEVDIRLNSYIVGKTEEETIPMALRRGCLAKEYIMGIDNARMPNGDNFALQIIELDDFTRSGNLVYSLALNGVELPTQALKVCELCSVFNIRRIFIDNDGFGKSLKDLLAMGCERYGVSRLLDIDDKNQRTLLGSRIIRMFSFTVPNIQEMFDKLKASLQDGRLKFPIDLIRHENQQIEQISLEIQRTKRELCNLQVEQRHGGFVYTVPSGLKRDRAMALGLANMAVIDYYYEELIPKPQTINAIGVWM